MEVKAGYKQTEVGIIPDDWDVKPLDTFSFVTSGKRLPLGKSLTDNETPHPYIRVTDMRMGTVKLSDIKFVPSEVFPSIKRYRIFKDDIFISVAGTLGIVGIIPLELDGANLTENADRITNITCSRDYLLHYLMSSPIQNAIEAIQTVGAQPKLALTRIRKFDIPLPPTKAEQEAIADALSDADALIEALNNSSPKSAKSNKARCRNCSREGILPKFEVKKDYKQTDVGFIPKDWELKNVSDIGDVKRGAGSQYMKAAKNGGVRLIRINDFLEDNPFYILQTDELKRFAIHERDVLFAGTGSVGATCIPKEDTDRIYLIVITRQELE